MARYLVVANQTLGCDELVARIDELRLEDPLAVTIAAPITAREGEQQWDYPPTDRAIPDAETIATWLAQDRLARELARLRELGVDATGEVVESDPVDRVREMLEQGGYDGVVVCTLPKRLSRWLLIDLPHRLHRATTVPVEHIPGSAGPSL